jgi:hypothetical protein
MHLVRAPDGLFARLGEAEVTAFPCRIKSAIAPTTSSTGTCLSTRCW